MASVSIQRILNTNDRAVLDMEYRNIISNLKLGSIESDTEIISLYQELMKTISSKTLNLDAARKLQANYDQWAEKHITQSISGSSGIIQNALNGTGKEAAASVVSNIAQNGLASISASFTPFAIVTVAGAVAVSCVSQYYAYQNAKLDAEFRRGLTEDLLRIERAEYDQYNALQSKLLDSAWRLLRQYRLPDEYRIVQSGIEDLFKALNETDINKRKGMLTALENEFRIYPPYWIYRAEAEQITGNDNEAAKCFDEFDKVWRPVLRNDVWKIEAEKFRVIQALNSGDKAAAMNHLETICANVERSDWADNIFAGLVYYMLGENEKAIKRVEVNINFGFGMKTSKAVLEEMKSGKMDIKSLSEKLSGLNTDLKRLNTENIAPATKLRRAEVLLQQKAGDNNNEEYKRMADIYYSTKDYRRAYVWYYVYGQRPGWHFFNDELNDIEGTGIFTFAKLSGSEIEAARKEAEEKIREIYALRNSQIMELLLDSAYGGNNEAQRKLADIYYNGDVDLGIKQHYPVAYIWYYVAGERAVYEEHGLFVRTFMSLFYNVFSLGGLLFGTDVLDMMEGYGLFNSAKVSDVEVVSARTIAQNIIKEIQASLITGEPAKRIDVRAELREEVARRSKRNGGCESMNFTLYALLLLCGYAVRPSKSRFL